jgi:hypothetical protein
MSMLALKDINSRGYERAYEKIVRVHSGRTAIS